MNTPGAICRSPEGVIEAAWRVKSALPALAMLLPVTWIAACWTARADLPMLSAPDSDIDYPTASMTPMRLDTRGTPCFV